MSARETALNISASPIVKEIGELSFMLYTPEGDSIALSRGIIVHVHTASDAIKHMIRAGYEADPGIRPGDIFCNNDASIGDVHNADVLTIVPIFEQSDLRAGNVLAGPAIVESPADTLAVPPGRRARLDEHRIFHIETGEV